MADPENGAYSRRRIDTLIDARIEGIEEAQERTNSKLDRLEGRLNYLFGALAVLSVVVNIVAPFVVHALSGAVVP